MKKIKKRSKIQKCLKSFPSVQTCLRAIFLKKFFCPVFHGWSSLRKFSEQSKKQQNSKIALNRFQKCPNVFWTCFGAIFRIFFAQCSKQGFSDFLDLKTWVQFYETLLNRHSFCIHATVNIRKPFPDFLDLNLWVKVPELKTLCSVFWTETISNRFSWLKIRGRYLKKIQEKNQEGFKLLKLSKIVLKCPNVFWGIFFEKKFSPVFHGSSSLRKNSKIQKCPKLFRKVFKRVLNMFCGDFFEKVFLPNVPWSLRKFSKNPKFFKNPKMPKIVPNFVETCFEHVLGQFFRKTVSPSVPWMVEPSKIFRTIKKTTKFKNCS